MDSIQIPHVPLDGDPTSDDLAMHQLEVHITDELTLAESSRPNDPVVESDRGWRPNPTAVKAYEARLLALRGAAEVMEYDRTAPLPDQLDLRERR